MSPVDRRPSSTAVTTSSSSYSHTRDNSLPDHSTPTPTSTTPPLTPNTAFKNNSIAVALEERESYEASLREMSTRLTELEAENEGMRRRLRSPSPGAASPPNDGSASPPNAGSATPHDAGSGTPPLTPNTAFKNNSIAVALEERESYEASLREMSARMQQLEEENEVIRGLDWRKRDAIIVDLSERLEEKEAWCIDAKREMAAMRAALADAKSVEGDNKGMSEELDAVREERDALAAALARPASQAPPGGDRALLEEVSAHADLMSSSASSLGDDLELAAAAVHRLKAERDEALRECDDLKGQVLSLEDMLGATVGSEERKDEEEKELQAEVRRLKFDNASLKGLLDTKSRQLADGADSAAQLDALKAVVERLKQQLQTAEEENEGIRNDNDTVRGENETLVEENTRLGDHSEELARENEELVAEKERLSDYNEELIREKEELFAEKERLSDCSEELTTRNDLVANNRELTTRNDDLVANNRELTTRNDDLTANIHQLTTRNDDLIAELDSLSAKNESLNTSNRKLSSTNATLAGRVETLESQLKTAQKETIAVATNSSRISNSFLKSHSPLTHVIQDEHSSEIRRLKKEHALTIGETQARHAEQLEGVNASLRAAVTANERNERVVADLERRVEEGEASLYRAQKDAKANSKIVKKLQQNLHHVTIESEKKMAETSLKHQMEMSNVEAELENIEENLESSKEYAEELKAALAKTQTADVSPHTPAKERALKRSVEELEAELARSHQERNSQVAATKLELKKAKIQADASLKAERDASSRQVAAAVEAFGTSVEGAIAAAGSKVDVAFEKIKKLEDARSRLSSAVGLQKQVVNSLSLVNEELRKKNSGLEKSKSAAEAAVKTLKSQLNIEVETSAETRDLLALSYASKAGQCDKVLSAALIDAVSKAMSSQGEALDALKKEVASSSDMESLSSALGKAENRAMIAEGRLVASLKTSSSHSAALAVSKTQMVALNKEAHHYKALAEERGKEVEKLVSGIAKVGEGWKGTVESLTEQVKHAEERREREVESAKKKRHFEFELNELKEKFEDVKRKNEMLEIERMAAEEELGLEKEDGAENKESGDFVVRLLEAELEALSEKHEALRSKSDTISEALEISNRKVDLLEEELESASEVVREKAALEAKCELLGDKLEEANIRIDGLLEEEEVRRRGYDIYSL